MSTLLIAGIESVAGANLALALADVVFETAPSKSGAIRVVGLSFEQDVNLPGIECHTISDATDEVVRELAAGANTQILLCGAAGVSCWSSQPTIREFKQQLNRDLGFAELAAEFSCELTALSSDAVFTGPWVFHEEDSDSTCTSQHADAIREWESEVQSALSNSLIVRTHAIGWSPNGDGWLEQLVEDVTTGNDRVFDQAAHATPISATDLTDPLMRAWTDGVFGILNIAGTERANELGIAKRVTLEFGLNRLEGNTTPELSILQTGFGRGETSLQTAFAQELLETRLPTISDGIGRLYEQSLNGFRDRVQQEAGVLEAAA